MERRVAARMSGRQVSKTRWMGGKGRKNFAKSSIIYEEKQRALVGTAKAGDCKGRWGQITRLVGKVVLI